MLSTKVVDELVKAAGPGMPPQYYVVTLMENVKREIVELHRRLQNTPGMAAIELLDQYGRRWLDITNKFAARVANQTPVVIGRERAIEAWVATVAGNFQEGFPIWADLSNVKELDDLFEEIKAKKKAMELKAKPVTEAVVASSAG